MDNSGKGKQRMKRMMSLLLAVLVLCSALPVGAVSATESDTVVAYPVEGGNIYFDTATGTVTDCDEFVTEAVIPEQIEGVTVTAIGLYAFASYQGEDDTLKRVVLPETVTEIGKKAFYDRSGLEEINIPSGVEVIQLQCFYHCKSLKSITLPQGLTEIEGMAFQGCEALTEIALPEGLEKIGDLAFEYCTALSEISLPGSLNSVGGAILNDTAVFQEESNWTGDCLYLDGWLLWVNETESTALQVQEGTVGIAGGICQGHSLKQILLPEGLKYIGMTSFMGCKGVSEIVFPESLEKLENGVLLSGNRNLRAFFKGDAPEIGKQVFYVCLEAKMEYGISEYMTVYYVEGREGWTSPLWNGYPTDVWDGLRTYPDEIYYPVEGGELCFHPRTGEILASTGEIIQAQIPEQIDLYEVSGISAYAFVGQERLHCVEIPASVTAVGEYAFSGCAQLKQVLFLGNAPESVDPNAFGNTAEDLTIYYMEGTEGWTTPEWNGISTAPWSGETPHPLTVTETEPTCTENGTTGYTCACGYSAEITKEALGHSYGENGCVRCGEMPGGTCGEDLTWVLDMPTGTLRITGRGEMYAYSYSKVAPWDEYKEDITDVVITGEVLSIGAYAFLDCKELRTVTLPKSITVIEESAFRGCVSLEELVLPENLEQIGFGAFQDCTALKEMVIPASANTLDDSVFFGCTGLTSVTIEAEITAIGWTFFYGCESLVEVTLPQTLTEIGRNAFTSCKSLVEIELPDALTTIGYAAFQHCDSLAEVTIPEKVSSIGAYAFSDCDALTSVYFCGDAPEVGGEAFCLWDVAAGEYVLHPELLLYYVEGKEGWTSPEWKGYPTAVWSPEHIHSYSTAVTAPTCTEPGYTTYSCACGDSYVDDYVDPTGHSYEATVTEPTCTEQGYTTYTCTVCGDSYTDDETDALGHDFEKGVCVRCGEKDPDYVPPERVEFADVSEDDWFCEAVNYAVENGLMNGMGEGKFEPDTAMSRAMLVTVLWRYAGSPVEGTNDFTDVSKDAWYAQAVAWAAKNGVVTGVGDGKFDPEGKITREQMAAILYRYSKALGLDVSQTAELSAFPDGSKTSDYAKEALSWAVAEGLITGTKNGSSTYLDPQGSATRAQVATILMRYIENVVK